MGSYGLGKAEGCGVRRLVVLLALLAGPVLAQPATLTSEVVRRLPAQEARQGVAVDERHLYAITNSKIGKYDKATGAKVGEWTAALSRWCDEQPALVAFTDSCLIHRAEIMQLRGEWADALDREDHRARHEISDSRRRTM